MLRVRVVLDFSAREDLNWLLSSLYGWNGNSLKVKNQIQIVTDARIMVQHDWASRPRDFGLHL